MMGRDLGDLEQHTMDGIDWTAEGSPDDIQHLNDLAYGLPEGSMTKGFGRISPEDFEIYVANLDGEPAACVLTLDIGEDCSIYAVATLPDARGKGLSKALMRQAIADARDRGLKTTTLQASKLGRPVYARAGYRDYGCFEMWERRKRD
jgi:GNAT superfamily N-acetyltransferase